MRALDDGRLFPPRAKSKAPYAEMRESFKKALKIANIADFPGMTCATLLRGQRRDRLPAATAEAVSECQNWPRRRLTGRGVALPLPFVEYRIESLHT